MLLNVAKTLVIAVFTAVLCTSSAVARSASLNHPEGAKVNIQCNKNACFVQRISRSGIAGNIEPAGPATTVNFVRIVKVWQAKGYR